MTVGEVFRLDLQAIKTTIVPPPPYTRTHNTHTQNVLSRLIFFKYLLNLQKY